MFPTVASDFRNFIQLEKTWRLFLHLNKRILPIFTVNLLHCNFTLNFVKNNEHKNKVILPDYNLAQSVFLTEL